MSMKLPKFDYPFITVLDARSGEWQARKKYWLSLGIKSELGRYDNELNRSDESVNIGFYSEKRKLERELKRKLSLNDARAILKERGRIKVWSNVGSTYEYKDELE